MERARSILVVLSLGALTACTPASRTEKLSHDILRFTVSGSGFMSLERVADFALLRAAELTLRDGAQHFLVLTSIPTVDTHFLLVVPVQYPRVEMVIRLVRQEPIPAEAYSAQAVRTELRRKYGLGDVP